MNFRNLDKELKLPPRIKILEALGCIGDQRIKVFSDKDAYVISSDGTRKYHVYVDLSTRSVYSDDNGTKLRGYIGYPIIAFLMLKGVIPIDDRLVKALTGIPWKKLNETYKHYHIVERIIFQKLKSLNIDEKSVNIYIGKVLRILSSMHLKFVDISTNKSLTNINDLDME
jgi:hypothetical protein